VLAVLLVAVSLGLSNFAAAIAIGLSGVDARVRLRVAVAFGLFEGAMPVLGLLIGRQLADAVGSHANVLGGLLLIATGGYECVTSARRDSNQEPEFDRRSMPRLLISGAGLSVDNLVVGFALGTYGVSFALAAIIIAVTSVTMSLVGLEIGDRLGSRFEHDTELLGGIVLIAVGAAIAIGIL
jgi:manganese efflux pump family protein